MFFGREQGSARHRYGVFLVMSLFCTPTSAQEFASASLPAPVNRVILDVRGAIANTNIDDAALFDMDMLKALPSFRLETTTAVTDGVRRFDGFLMRDLLERVGAQGTTITATALNDYVVDIDIEEFDRFDVLVAYEMDGAPLLPGDKGPLWIVYPRDQHAELQDIRYDYRWIWQLRRLDIK
ncbi:MAG: molybdopterin-dependent oxidoreductase [Pseudaminobacter sp.]